MVQVIVVIHHICDFRWVLCQPIVAQIKGWYVIHNDYNKMDHVWQSNNKYGMLAGKPCNIWGSLSILYSSKYDYIMKCGNVFYQSWIKYIRMILVFKEIMNFFKETENDTYDGMWRNMNFHELLWTFMNFYELLWTSMNFHELPWTFMNFHELSSFFVIVFFLFSGYFHPILMMYAFPSSK